MKKVLKCIRCKKQIEKFLIDRHKKFGKENLDLGYTAPDSCWDCGSAFNDLYTKWIKGQAISISSLSR